jgi:hypothetical protein
MTEEKTTVVLYANGTGVPTVVPVGATRRAGPAGGQDALIAP